MLAPNEDVPANIRDLMNDVSAIENHGDLLVLQRELNQLILQREILQENNNVEAPDGEPAEDLEPDDFAGDSLVSLHPEQTSTEPPNTRVVVVKGNGEAIDLGEFQPNQTVRSIKEIVTATAGISIGKQKLYVIDDNREGAELELVLANEILVSQAMTYSQSQTELQLAMLVVDLLAHEFLPMLRPQPNTCIGMEQGPADGQFDECNGVAFVPSIPDWLVTTDRYNHRVKVHHAQTGAMICKLGQRGTGEGEFNEPQGVAVSADAPLLAVVDRLNNRVQLLRLVRTGQTAELEFVRSIGTPWDADERPLYRYADERGSDDGMLNCPAGISFYGAGSILVTEYENHRVSQFDIDGTFVRTIGSHGAAAGQFHHPSDVAVVPDVGIAVSEYSNNRVQLFGFDGAPLGCVLQHLQWVEGGGVQRFRQGGVVQQFGKKGTADSEFMHPSGLAVDIQGNMLVLDANTSRVQVFSSSGEHLYTRADLHIPLHGAFKSVAWSEEGNLAISDGRGHCVLVWAP
jgi:DNA-binding beta-propeller fold protein YncE